MISLTPHGETHVPRVAHHFGVWGGIKELLRVHGGSARRDQILEVLEYCWHNDPELCPNTKYLDYAIKSGWLTER